MKAKYKTANTLAPHVLRRFIIKKIRIQNFKSFKNAEIHLGDFNVIVGANASGKSNFVEIFKFISNIKNLGLEDAIAESGGIDSVKNFRLGTTSNLVMEIEIEPVHKRNEPLRITNSPRFIRINKITYRFELKLGKKSGVKIVDDHLFCESAYDNNGDKSKKLNLSYTNKNGKILITTKPNILKIKPYMKGMFDMPKGRLMLESTYAPFVVNSFRRAFEELATVYDFNPPAAKNAISLTGKPVLKKDGSNLALVVRDLIKDKEKASAFVDLMAGLLPFIKKIDTEKFMYNTILLSFIEKYYKNKNVPANLISDGSISMTALIIAIYFQKNNLRVFEEPERGIHSALISKMIYYMKDAASIGQILITTHSSEVVKHAGIENIYLMSRDTKGFSSIIQPKSITRVKKLLENDFGIGELHAKNLLRGDR